MIKDKKILITGASGFIGSRLLKLLQRKNINFRILTRKHLNNIEDQYIFDIEKDSFNEEIFRGISSIIHLAGYAHDTRYSIKEQKKITEINKNFTIKLAKESLKYSIEDFTFISSVKAGGIFNIDSSEIIIEKNISNDHDFYGKLKKETEDDLYKILGESSTRLKIIRPSLTYGKGVKGNLSLIIKFLKLGVLPVFPDIKNRKSMIHVDDLSRAILFLHLEDLRNEVFIITDGKFYSTKEIFESLSFANNKQIMKIHIPMWTLTMIRCLSPKIKRRIDKLLSNEPYSSEKIESLGFKARFKLHNIYEKDF